MTRLSYVPQVNAFVYEEPDNLIELASSCPSARELNGCVFVPNRLSDLQVMVKRGINPVPMPMVDYDWPRNKRTIPEPWFVQRAQANFLVLNPGCFNLSEMRTGKTLSALWAADYVMQREPCKTMIVGQLSTLQSVWGEAIFEHFIRRRTYKIIHGPPEKRLRDLEADVDFYIINYEGLNIGARRVPGGVQLDRLARAIECRTDIKIAIVDEASVYADPKSLRSVVARRLLTPRKYLWTLTGTPYKSAPTDVYGIAKIVNNAFGESFTSFKRRTMLQLSPFRWVAKKSASEDVARLLTPSIRFTQEDCFDARDLVIMKRTALLSTEQSKLCTKLKNELLVNLKEQGGGVVEAVNEAALRSKLLQICCGEVYDLDHVPRHVDNTNRLSVLKEIIDESPKKVIVFAPFTSVIQMLNRELRKDYTTIVVDGSIKGGDRAEALKAFQDASHPSRVMVAHPGPIARGLDLTSAATVVWFAPTDKPEDYVQANERINGAKQTHARTVVHIYATLTEKEIYRRLETGQSLAGAVMKLIEDRT